MNRRVYIGVLCVFFLAFVVSLWLPVYYTNQVMKERDVQGLIESLKGNNEYGKIADMRYLGLIGEDAYEALPYMFDLLNDRDGDVRHASIRAIRQIGPKEDMIDEMINAMDNRYHYIRSEIAICIGELGEFGHEAMPVLFEAYNDDNISVRLEAINALSKVGEHGEIIGIIISAIDDEDDVVRVAAIRIVAEFGMLRYEALPKLEKLANGENKWIATNARNAIQKIESSKVQ